MSARAAVVIVNWGAPARVENCVQSFLASGTAARDIAVVDNAHANRNSDALRSKFDRIEVLSPDTNLGFAGGANAGINWAFKNDYDYIFLANNDLTVNPDTLPPLAAFMDARSDVGIAGALPCYRDTGIPHFMRASINWSRGKPAIEEGEPRDSDAYQTEFATGCSILMRSEALRAAGTFDASYFLYWEDVDLCFRIRAAGYSVMMVPQSRALHDVSGSTGHSSPLTLYYQTRNRLMFFQRHAPSIRTRWWLVARVSSSRFLRGILWLISGRSAEGYAYILGVIDYWRGRTGPRDGLHGA